MAKIWRFDPSLSTFLVDAKKVNAELALTEDVLALPDIRQSCTALSPWWISWSALESGPYRRYRLEYSRVNSG
jgi:hypothetical protein